MRNMRNMKGGILRQYRAKTNDAQEARRDLVVQRDVHRLRDTARRELVAREARQRVDTALQVAPKVVHSGGAGEHPSHADDGDRRPVRPGCGATVREEAPHGKRVRKISVRRAAPPLTSLRPAPLRPPVPLPPEVGPEQAHRRIRE